jgi:hypothetical protein
MQVPHALADGLAYGTEFEPPYMASKDRCDET